MSITKTRWSRVYESSEEELLDFLHSRNLTAERIHLTEFETTSQPATDAGRRLWCAEGSMTVRLASTKVSAQPGDSVQLPSNTEFELLAGISGCVYYEAAD
jgi:mannose-6-phosphate isomerase class I